MQHRAVEGGLRRSFGASAPATERFTVSLTNPGTVDCGTFQDQFTDFLDGKGTLYFDSVSNPIKIVIHWEHHSNDTNSVTGLTLHEHGHYTERIDLVAGTDTITGNEEIVNRPGTGVVVQDVGKVVTDADGTWFSSQGDVSTVRCCWAIRCCARRWHRPGGSGRARYMPDRTVRAENLVHLM